MAKVKKPIYKRWWVWVIALFLVFAGIGAGGSEDATPDATEKVEIKETQSEELATRAMPETEPVQKIQPVAKAAPDVEQPVKPEPDPQPEPQPQEVVPIIVTEPEPEPASEPAPEPQPKRSTFAVANTGRTVSLDPDTLVWKSETGSKFHTRNDCGNMNPDKARQITVADAEKQGLKACEKCY